MSDLDDLEIFWNELGVTHRKDRTPDELRQAIAPTTSRSDFVIGTKNQLLVVIHADGTMEYGQGYDPDGAAMVFWEAMARRRADYEQRMLLAAHMDTVLTRLGRFDLEYERQVMLSREEGLSVTEQAQREQYVELARGRLEMEVHQVLELARGLARREPPE